MNTDPVAIIVLAVGVVVMCFIAVIIWRAAGKGGEKPAAAGGIETHVRKQCLSCGWEGMVSKYHKKCSNCGDKLL